MKCTVLGTILTALAIAAPAGAAAQQAPARPAPTAPAPAAPAPQTAKPAPAAPAQAPAPAPVQEPFPADAKIAFVNMQYVVQESRLGKTGQERIQALVTKQNADRAAKNGEIQKLQQEIQSGQSVLSAQVLAQKNADLDRLTRAAQFDEQQRQVDLNNLNEQLLDEFQEKVLPIIEQMRKERNLWLVMTAGDGSGIAAVHPGINLSLDVVKRLDAVK
ncbi:MAG: OmpH family outer membrane protein [Acidobacteria bacterium]|nr:OmpH family outer membrane protein [Acidobacteriota bacterium]